MIENDRIVIMWINNDTTIVVVPVLVVLVTCHINSYYDKDDVDNYTDKDYAPPPLHSQSGQW